MHPKVGGEQLDAGSIRLVTSLEGESESEDATTTDSGVEGRHRGAPATRNIALPADRPHEPRHAPVMEEGGSEETVTSSQSDEDLGSDSDAKALSPASRKSTRTDLNAPRNRLARIGYLAQYFAVGIIYGGLPATVYGVFLGYLAVPSYVYATVSVVSSLPWSFKFLFGLINDTIPICGLHRKPYMVFGWAFCGIMLVVLYFRELPAPYWCVDPLTGKYIKQITAEDGHRHVAVPCNPDAPKQGGEYAILMMLAALGYVIADVAADGLTVEYAKGEPLETRGATQASAYLTRTIGSASSTLFIGLCMNSKRYNGFFSWGLSFNQVCLCLAVPAFLMVPISGFLVEEPRSRDRHACGEYMSLCWNLLCSRAMFFVILYSFLTPMIGNISTTAGGLVKSEWAKVQNLQDKMFSLVGHFLFAGGLWLVKRKFLHVSWRAMLVVTSIILNVIDSVFTTLTIFDVIRNQYFYLGETVLVEVPTAANFVVATFVIVEMADDGNEGLVYGLLTTAANLGGPFARAIGNQIFGAFSPSLSDEENYIEDSPAFRVHVFWSFLLSYGFAFASLGCLYFLPRQKEEAQERKRTWPRHPRYGIISVLLLSCALAYSLVVNFLSMFPSTMCLKIAGGEGCDEAASR